SVAVWGKTPSRTPGKSVGRGLELIVLRRPAIVPVEVFDLGFHVIIAWEARRVIDEQAVRYQGLQSIKAFPQPHPVVRVVIEIDAPALIGDGPDADTGVMPVVANGLLESIGQFLS